MMSQQLGKLIVVEGLEGAGKSSAIEVMFLHLKTQGLPVLRVREPGGTLLGEHIRQFIKADYAPGKIDPRAELLLFYAARVQLIEESIKPALQQGFWVLADRFDLSSWAYQGGGRKVDLSFIEALSTYCLASFKADLTFFLEISPQQGLLRAQQRSRKDRFEQESLIFFESVDEIYHQCLKKINPLVMIDASRDLTVVHDEILIKLSEFLAISHASIE